MHGVEQDLPKFDNLTTLILDRCDLTGKEHTMLDLFLHNAPKLENITLQNCKVCNAPILCHSNSDVTLSSLVYTN
jgi:hypothetical protein